MYLEKTLQKFAAENDCELFIDEPMSQHTTFKIGGNARCFISVKDVNTLKKLITLMNSHSFKYMIIGKGSNLLINDTGLDMAVIKLCGAFSEIKANGGDTCFCGAGVSLSVLCIEAMKNSLSGLEFAYGIPGTLGGAVYMNAGAYGGEIKDVIKSVTFMSPDGNINTLTCDELEFSYRQSVFLKNGGIILGAELLLCKRPMNDIKKLMDETMLKRKYKQPLEFPSAGSVFKRPEGNYAGTLIESCGLKGKRVGGAEVSTKHAGFIINIGGATAADVVMLIEEVKEEVFKKTGYKLNEEIKVI